MSERDVDEPATIDRTVSDGSVQDRRLDMVPTLGRRRFLWLASTGLVGAACGAGATDAPGESMAATSGSSAAPTPTSPSRTPSPTPSSTTPMPSPEAAIVSPTAPPSESSTPEPVETVPDTTPTPSPSLTATDGAPLAVEVVCREAWGAQDARPGAATHEVRNVMVHHPAVVADDGDDEAARFLGYQRYHQEQSFADIAYHLGIGRSGTFYELRDPRTAGETFTAYDPAGWFLILVDGHFDEQDPTEAQVTGLQRAIAWACATYGVSPDDVAGHRDEASTTCPGERLDERLPAITRQASEFSFST